MKAGLFYLGSTLAAVGFLMSLVAARREASLVVPATLFAAGLALLVGVAVAVLATMPDGGGYF